MKYADLFAALENWYKYKGVTPVICIYQKHVDSLLLETKSNDINELKEFMKNKYDSNFDFEIEII